MTALLAIEGLRVAFQRGTQQIIAVRELSLEVAAGECVAVIGESGSGKTQAFIAAMGLLPRTARASGSIRFQGQELLGADPRALNAVRGSSLAMVFQDPMTSLTPHLRIGVQLAEVLVAHRGTSWRDAELAAAAMLERVRVTEPERRLRQYPHELSGGMRQRVMIAMSLLCGPALVIADEPTTALDVTVQAQILEMLRAMRVELGMALVMISHDLGVVAGIADRVAILYAGRLVEEGRSSRVYAGPQHPYTAELLKCAPNLHAPRLARMPSLPGQPPDPSVPETGCAFVSRCPRAAGECATVRPPLVARGTRGSVACHFPLP